MDPWTLESAHCNLEFFLHRISVRGTRPTTTISSDGGNVELRTCYDWRYFDHLCGRMVATVRAGGKALYVLPLLSNSHPAET